MKYFRLSVQRLTLELGIESTCAPVNSEINRRVYRWKAAKRIILTYAPFFAYLAN